MNVAEQQALAAARRVHDRLKGQAQRALADVWHDGDLNDYAATQERILKAFPGMVAVYGGAAAEWGSQWYQLLRDANGVEGGVRAVLDEVPNLDVLNGSVRNGVHSLYTRHDADAALSTLQGSLTRHVMQMERNTIILTAAKDREENGVYSGWGIVPNPDCCDWCLTKDTKGKAMYTSRKTALATFHDGCTCSVAPMIEKYHPPKRKKQSP